MNSTDFGSLVSPAMVGKKAKGGKADPEPQKHHVTITVQPHPVMGALAHALILAHLHHRMRGGR